MIVWLKDLQSNWLSWLAISITMLVSSASCSLAISMISAGGNDAIPLAERSLECPSVPSF